MTLAQRLRWLSRLLMIDLVLLATAVMWVAVHAVPSTEAVRLRNALLFEGVEAPANLGWAPTEAPSDFRVERHSVPPYLAEAVRHLDLGNLQGDWSRALAISRHLQLRLNEEKGPIKAGLEETYQRIIGKGEGYCGDFAEVFAAMAYAAGIQTRTWAFSFDGYGGHGHVLNEVWDSSARKWRAISVFDNYLFVDASSGEPLSVLELRAAMRGERGPASIVPINSQVRHAFKIPEKAIDYYRRGAKQWYIFWGNTVVTVDQDPIVRMATRLGKYLEQPAAIVSGVQPGIRVVATPESKSEIAALAALRPELLTAAAIAIVSTLVAIVLATYSWYLKRWRTVMPSQSAARSSEPAIVVFSTLFPSPAQPQGGIFIRERMFRVADQLPLTVVSPYPWFPLQGLARKWKRHFRPPTPRRETQLGIEVLRPRFLSFPGMLKRLDGLSLALCSYPTVRKLKRQGRLNVLDAHFAYPDGYAAVLLGRWLAIPVTVTLRGTESRQSNDPVLARLVGYTLRHARRVFAVSTSLLNLGTRLGLQPGKGRVVGNGIDIQRFSPRSKSEARASLGLPADARVLVSVGGLVERKGFHRVIEQIPGLLECHPDLHYLIVGGPGPEGDFSAELHAQIRSLGLESRVHMLGAMPPDDLPVPLSAADVFVLATRNEGWANVFLEAMACGLPVVSTDVGGNREVVCDEKLGIIVPFGDGNALAVAIDSALQKNWDRAAIRAYAEANSWTSRVSVLVDEFRRLAGIGDCAAEAENAVTDTSWSRHP